MPILYYVLSIWSRDGGIGARVFHLESNLLFPSPIGTQIFVQAGDENFLAIVSLHQHQQREIGDAGDFHMILCAVDDSYYAPNSDESDGIGREFPHIPNEDHEKVCEGLIDNGWEEVSDSVWV
ncbi:MAG: hypothetical protein WDZ90_00010 [Candidatus Paceibacterota bacterium]